MTGASRSLLIKIAVSTGLKTASALAALIFSVVISRMMSLEDASHFFFLQSAVTILAVVIVMGMDLLVLRATAAFHQKSLDGEIVELRHSVLTLAGLAAAVLLPLSYAALSFRGDTIPGSARTAGLLFPLAAPFIAFNLLNAEFLRGLGRYNLQVIFQGVALPVTATSLLGVWWLLSDTVTVSAAAMAFLAASILVATVAAAIWKAVRSQLKITGRRARFRPELLGGIKYFFLLSGAQTVMQFAPLIIVGLLQFGTDLGLYFAALRIAMLVSFVLTASNVIIAPLLSRAHARSDREGMVSLVRLSSALGGLSATPVALLLFLRGDAFLGLFGPAYVAALPILRILLLGQLVNAFSGAVVFFLIMSQHERIVARINAVALGINLICGYVLIGAYGAIGAAITATFVTAFINLLAVAAVFTRGKFMVFPWINRRSSSAYE